MRFFLDRRGSEGVTGDPSLLVMKAILDFFTGLNFASTMEYTIATLIITKFVVQSLLFFASLIVPVGGNGS